MLKHIVFIKLSETYIKAENRNIITEIILQLNDLPNHIDEILDLETGLNISSRPSAFDLSLSVSFNNKKELNIYQVHPKHKEVLKYLSSLELSTAVVDYIK
jgi:hypothetical protein